jgi:hypothetical protein
MSTLIFRGGPLDGTNQPTRAGWPAPAAYEHRNITGVYHRAETVVECGEARHYYDYALTSAEEKEPTRGPWGYYCQTLHHRIAGDGCAICTGGEPNDGLR